MTANAKGLWVELLNHAKQLSDCKTLKVQSSENIRYMKKIGFAQAFIDCAEIQRGLEFSDLQIDWMYACLLYTSDAADDMQC